MCIKMAGGDSFIKRKMIDSVSIVYLGVKVEDMVETYIDNSEEQKNIRESSGGGDCDEPRPRWRGELVVCIVAGDK